MNRRKRTAGAAAAALETAIQLIEPVATAASQVKKKTEHQRAFWNQRATLKPKMIIKIDFTVCIFLFFFLFFIITVCPIYTIAGNEKETFFDIQNTPNVSHTLDEYLRPFFFFLSPFILLT
jgi:hypothetical protein